MLFLLMLMIGVLLGLWRKGKISNILDFKMKKAGLFIVAMLIQTLGQILGMRGVGFFSENALWMLLIIHTLLLAGIWFNRQYMGFITIGIGSVFNALAMAVNGGKMPISMQLMSKTGNLRAIEAVVDGRDYRHAVLHDGTGLTFLSDIIYVPGFLGKAIGVMSIGDVVVGFGILLMMVEIVSNRRIIK